MFRTSVEKTYGLMYTYINNAMYYIDDQTQLAARVLDP